MSGSTITNCASLLVVAFAALVAYRAPSPISSLLLSALPVGVCALAILVARFGARRVGLVALFLAGFALPLNSLRAIGEVKLADVLLVCAGTFGAAANVTGSSPLQAHKRARPDLLAALFMILGGLVGSFFAGDAVASVAAIGRYALAAVGLAIVFVAVARTRGELRAVSWGIVLGATTNSMVALLTSAQATRAEGLSVHPNHMAMSGVLACGIAAGLFLAMRGRSQWLAAGCWALIVLGTIKTGSRAGVAGDALVVALVLGFTRSTRVLVSCSAAALAMVALMHFGQLHFNNQNALVRLLGHSRSAAQSDKGRAILRERGIATIARHPITGIGFERAGEAHNLYIQAWAAAGLLGLVALAMLWGTTARAMAWGLHNDLWVLGVACGFMSFLVVAFTSNNFWDRYVWYSIAIVVTAMRLPLNRSSTAQLGAPSSDPTAP